MSGKVAKRIRKNKKLSKRTAALCLALCMGGVPAIADSDFILSVYPHFSKPFGTSHSIENGVGAGLKFTFRPVDYLNLFAYGDYLSLSLPNVNPISLLDGGLGAGYHLGISDHFAFDINFEVGAYTAKATKRLSGLTGGVNLAFTYRVNPVASIDVNASGSHYASGSSPLMTINAAVSPGLSLNFTELFNNKTKLQFSNQELAPVFPVLYGWYENNSFGKITVTNKEESSITDVTVSFYQPQYMGQPKECAKFTNLKKDESVDIDLYAFFNEQMLELTEKTDTHANVIVSYSCLGQKRTQVYSMVVPVYGRNNMSWDDDRRAAVFVSSKDPAAMLFAKYVTSVVRDNVRNGVPANLQYAMGIFEALDQFGLSYVIDPTSAFEDNVGTSSIDFLQFPYQTLMYRGGDCDDISILVCSLFEAVGIRTAFITIPGHIYMAFDSGLTLAQAQREFTNLNELIIDGNEVWVPLEITLSDEGFNKAWRVGAREWNTAARAGTAALYKMNESWQLYQPVNVPSASAYFTMPDREIVAKLFDNSVDQWIAREIEPQIKMYEAKLAIKDDVQTRNSLGILYGKYGLFVKADEQFKKARRQGYVPSVLNTGNVYFSMKDYERAMKWYKSVLKEEPENVLAFIGIARCAYELAEYEECDAAYAKAKELAPEIADEYAYLGTFVSSKGRAFSLADRLQHTIWSEEKEEVSEKLKNVIPLEEPENTEVIKEDPVSDVDLDDLMDFSLDMVALIPDAEPETEEEEDLEDYDIAAAGDGNDDDPPSAEEVLTETPEIDVADIDITSFTENFTGLSSEVSLDVTDYIYEDYIEEDDAEQAVPQVKDVEKPVYVQKQAEPEAPAAVAVTVVVEAPAVAVETPKVAVTTPAPAVAVTTPAVATETPKVAVTTPAPAPVAPAAVPLSDIEDVTPEPQPVETQVAAVIETPAVELQSPVAEPELPVEIKTAPVETPAAVAIEIETEEIQLPAEAPVEAPLAVAIETPAVELELPAAEPVEIQVAAVIETPAEELELPAAEPVEPQVAAVIETPAVEEELPLVVETPAVEAEPLPVFTQVITPAEPEEIVPMAVPRFTAQPSAEWAPEEAYVAETIPGMKSFEEEMGEYQNDKAFLYETTALLDTDPDKDIDEPELEQKGDQYASAGIPDVNPFSSYLSEEDAKVVEKITDYKLEKPVIVEPVTPVVKETKAAENKIAEMPVVTPSVAEPVVKESEPAVETPAVVTEPAVEEKPAEVKEKKSILAKITEKKADKTEKVNKTDKTEKTAETEKVEESEKAEKVEAAETPAEVKAETPEEVKPETTTQTTETKTEKAPESKVEPKKESVQQEVKPVETEVITETKEENKSPKGLLALATIILAGAGTAGAIAFKKTKDKKKEEEV